VKGVLALEQEIQGARMRLLRLCDAGRLGGTPHALKLAKQIETILHTAELLSRSLRAYEVGRQLDDNDTRSSRARSQTEHSTD